MEKVKKTSENKKTKNIEVEILHKVTVQDLDLKEPIKLTNSSSFSTYVRVLHQNWRQGTLASKGRSEVTCSNRKPWKQKGTGRARAGSVSSPLWRGGGVTFGPQMRVRTLKIPKKIKSRVLGSLLSDFLSTGKIVYVDWALEGDKPKTSAAQKFLKQSGLFGKKIAFFISEGDMLTAASFANIPKVHTLLFDQPNAFDLVNSNYWLFFKKDFERFKGMVSKWI